MSKICHLQTIIAAVKNISSLTAVKNISLAEIMTVFKNVSPVINILTVEIKVKLTQRILLLLGQPKRFLSESFGV